MLPIVLGTYFSSFEILSYLNTLTNVRSNGGGMYSLQMAPVALTVKTSCQSCLL